MLAVHTDGGNIRAAFQYLPAVLEAAGHGSETHVTDKRDRNEMFHPPVPRLAGC
jgi:hypothetical protein